MPIVTLSQEKIIQCYVSLFGRAPERAGLDYWVSQIEGGRTWQQVAQDMYNVQPAREMYPDWLSNEGVIQRFYTGVFGREPDAEGLKYWSKQLEAKTRGEVICDLITAAVNYGGTDPAGLLSKSLFSNKVDIGVAFALEHNGSDIAFSKTLLKYVKAGSEGKAVPTQLMTQHFDSSASTPVIRLKIDSGASSDDLITNTAEIEVTGAEAGALISYSQDGGSVWSDRIDASADGLKNLVVRVYEPNNQKTSLVLFSFTLDTTVVAISDVALKNDTGASNNDKVTRIGELDVKTSSESSVLYSTDSGKNWGTSYVPREGHNLVFVRAIDIAGNYSEVRTIEFDLDTLIVTPTLRLKVDSGNTSTDSLTNESEVVVVGTETNADLAYSWDAGATWSSNYDAGTDGEKTLLVRTTDKAGNQARSAAFKFILDVTAPAKPIVSLLSDSGASDHDHISTSPTLALTTESGASIAYSFDGGINWNEVYNPGGDGTKGVLVRSTDKAGNVSQSVPFNFTLDTSTTAPIVILANDTGNSNTDRISKDGNLTISNIEAGATLSYSLDGTTFTNEFVAAQGENTVIVRANDVAGNSAQTLLSFKLDTVAPMVPSVNLFADSGMSVIDKITKTALLNVVAEVDSTTSYSFDGGVSWSETYAPGADGTKIVFVRSTDKAGNVSQSSAFSFTLDTSTTIPSVALASDTGASNDDRISRETTLSIANVEAGASLTYSIDGGTLFTTSFTAVQGENAVIVRATDTAGNTAQTLFNFKLDTVAPYAPSVSLLTDSGLSASDKLTKVATLNVTAEVATTTTYSLDGGANWSENYVLGADGDKTVLVRSTDKAGNISQSAVFNFTLDTSVATPGVGLLNDTGRFDSDRLSNDGVLSIVNLEAGANLFFSMDGGVNWSERYAPGADGIKTVLVRATDKAGNISQSSALNFTLDTTTTAPNVVLKNDTGNSNSDRISRDSSLSINNVEADATLSYSTDGGNSFTANFVAAQGENAVIVRATDLAGNTAQTLLNFKFDTVLPATPIVNLLTDSGVSSSDKLTKSAALNLTTEEGTTTNYSFDGGASWLEAYAPGIDGVKSVLVRSIDKAGNISQSAAFNFTLDSSTNAPRVVLASDTGSSNNDRISKDGGLLISNVETGATLSYSMDGNTFTNSFIAVQGENAVIVRATDAAGNTAQTLLNFKLDSVAPIAPTVTLSIDSGTSGSDKLTKSAALNITKEDGAFLTYSFDGGVSWSEVYAAGADGMKTVLVRSTDAAGNTSQNTAYSFTLDTSISAPVVALANDTGSLNSDSISKDGSLAISNVEAGSIVSYSVDGGNLFTSAFVAVQGENAVIVRAMDAAGNTAQRLFNFTFDTAAPIAPSVSLATDSGTSSSDKLTNAVTLNSITEAGATVTYSSDGGVNWTEIYTPGADGAKTVLVRSTDKAGNTSQNSVVSFTLDTKTTVPSVVLTNDTGNSNGDRISRDVTLSTTNVEAGASLSYSLDGGLSFTNNLVPKQGANSIIVRSTDLAGNSAQANPIVITYDSIVPVMSSSRITYNNQGTKFDATDDEWSLEFEDATSLSIDPSLLQITNVTRSSSILPTSATFVGNTLKIKASALPSNWYFGDAIDFSFASGAIRDLAGNVSAAIPITGNFDTVSLNAKVAVVNIAAGQTYQGVAGWNDQFTGSLENLVGTTINGDSGDKETVTLTTAGTFRINHGWMPAGFLRNISTLNLANGNNDIFYSGDAVDAYLRGAHGVREINGGTGNDLISSAFFPAGTSIKLTGGAGDDLLNVDAGTEIVAATLEGGDGNDTLRTNLIAEPVINGGNGIDTFVLFNNSGSSVTVTDANFAKVSQIEKFNLSLISESVSYITLGKNANAAFANGLTFMTPTIVNFNGAALTVPSTIDGSNSNDVIVTGSGNDQIFGGPGADTLNGGAGNDIFRYFYSVDSLWSGFDTVFVNAGDKLSGIYGSSGIIKVTSGTQVTTDLITVTDFVNALQEKIKTGTGAIGGVYYLSITDSQQTAGVNYSGTYIVQTVTGEPSKIDSFDTVIKLIGAAGVSVVGADLLIL